MTLSDQVSFNHLYSLPCIVWDCGKEGLRLEIGDIDALRGRVHIREAGVDVFELQKFLGVCRA